MNDEHAFDPAGDPGLPTVVREYIALIQAGMVPDLYTASQVLAEGYSPAALDATYGN